MLPNKLSNFGLRMSDFGELRLNDAVDSKLVLRQLRRELHTLQYVLAGKKWVLIENVFDRISSREEFEDCLGGNPRPPDNGLAVTDVWVDNYTIHKRSLSDGRSWRKRQTAKGKELSS